MAGQRPASFAFFFSGPEPGAAGAAASAPRLGGGTPEAKPSRRFLSGQRPAVAALNVRRLRLRRVAFDLAP
jgi:hypothetical protein